MYSRLLGFFDKLRCRVSVSQKKIFFCFFFVRSFQLKRMALIVKGLYKKNYKPAITFMHSTIWKYPTTTTAWAHNLQNAFTKLVPPHLSTLTLWTIHLTRPSPTKLTYATLLFCNWAFQQLFGKRMKLLCSRHDIWVKWEKKCVVEERSQRSKGVWLTIQRVTYSKLLLTTNSHAFN